MLKISGAVIKGKQRGGNLGFPTVNIESEDALESGVYAGRTIVSGRSYKSAVFISNNGKAVESHILGFSGDIYGQAVDIEIGKKIREIKKFKNDEELIFQIKKDLEIINNL